MAKESRESKFWKTLGPFVVPTLFFLTFFFFILVYIDPGVIYTYNGIHKYSFIIEFTREFLLKTAAMPGGVTRLAIAIIIYSCYYPWIGASIFTFIAWALYICCGKYIRNLGVTVPLLAPYLPVFLLVPVFTRYNLHYFEPIIPVLGVLLLCIGYQNIRASSIPKRVTACAVLVLVSYYFFGWPGFYFLFLVGIHELFKRDGMLVPLGIICICTGILFYIWKKTLFPFETIFQYKEIFDFKRPVIHLYLYFPAASVIFNSRIYRFLHFDTIMKKRSSVLSPAFFRHIQEFVLILIVVITLIWAVRNPINKNIRHMGQILYYSRNEMWPQLLGERDSFIFDDFPRDRSWPLLMTSNSIYRALYYTGQLGSNMFSFPQVSDAEPLLLSYFIWNIYFPVWALGVDLYMDLGTVNFADKIAGEAMENMGHHPFLTYRRALIQIAKGNKELAYVYLNKLSTMPIYRKQAKSLLNDLNDDSKLESYKEIKKLKSYMDKEDYTLHGGAKVDEETVLLSLLESNRHNKMAFEYLMAYYLLTRQPSKIAENLFRIDDFDYRSIPTHYEEAFLIYNMIKHDRPVQMPKLPIRNVTQVRFEQFLQAYTLYSQHVPGVKEKMYEDFGSSYFYFYMFGFIPGGKK